MTQDDSPKRCDDPQPLVPVLGYWDLSTAHATPQDLARVGESKVVAGYAYPEGAFVSLDLERLTPDLAACHLAAEGFSGGFAEVVRRAITAKMHLIPFDADGPTQVGLPNEVESWESRPGRPHDYWPDDCERLSRAEGWILTNDGRDLISVSRIDCPADDPQLGYSEPKFAGDGEAYEHVLRRAAEGSRMHLLAVALCHHPARERMELTLPEWLVTPKRDPCYQKEP